MAILSGNTQTQKKQTVRQTRSTGDGLRASIYQRRRKKIKRNRLRAKEGCGMDGRNDEEDLTLWANITGNNKAQYLLFYLKNDTTDH